MTPGRIQANYIVRTAYHRLFEWTMAVMMTTIGLHLAIWPKAVASSNFRYMLSILNAEHLSLFYLVVGVVRIIALLANGHWPDWGPKLRGAASCFGAIIWAQMGLALSVVSYSTDIPPSIGVSIYGTLVLAELFSTYKAAADVRTNR